MHGVVLLLSRGILYTAGVALLVYGGWSARALAERQNIG